MFTELMKMWRAIYAIKEVVEAVETAARVGGGDGLDGTQVDAEAFRVMLEDLSAIRSTLSDAETAIEHHDLDAARAALLEAAERVNRIEVPRAAAYQRR